ncbi:MAG: polysaccharide biosynthesis protein [Sedimentisphaerales bacterium]|nr:polysaccharide biosynthesis protein [Sedimentisphaerales bacterium]
MKKRISLVTSVFSNWAVLLVNIIVGFILTPYIIARLGTGSYGMWVLIGGFVGYYDLLDIGIRSAVARYVSRYFVQKDFQSMNEVVNTASAIFCFIGALVIVLSVLFAGWLARFFNIQGDELIVFKYLVWLLSISAGLAFPRNVLSAVLIGHERFVVSNAIRVITLGLKGILSFLALFLGGGLASMAMSILAVTIFGFLAEFVVVKKSFAYINFSPRFVMPKLVPTLFSFGLHTFIGKMGDTMRLRIDSVVIGKFLNLEAVGVYGLASTLFGHFYRFNIGCSGVTMPRLAGMAAQYDKDSFAGAVMRYSIISSLLAGALGAAAVVVAEDFIRLWVPENFAGVRSSAIIFVILVVSLVPDLMSNVSWNALQGLKKHHYYAYQAILEGFVNLGLSIVLVRYMGMVGVALGTAIPALIVKLFIQPAYCHRIFKIGWWEYMFHILIKPFGILLGCVALFRIGGLDFTARSYLMVLLKGAAVLVVYGVASYIILDVQTRRFIDEKFKSIIAVIGLLAEKSGVR